MPASPAESQESFSLFDDKLSFGGVGNLVTALLRKEQLTYRQISEQLGNDHTAWFRWANDERFIPSDRLVDLAHYANVDPDHAICYGLLNGFRKHYPDMFDIKKIRDALRDILTLIESY